MMRAWTLLAGVALGLPSMTSASDAMLKAPHTLSVTEANSQMATGALTSEALTRQFLDRIAALDDAGPQLNAVIATFPDALDQARAMDAERHAGKWRGPLHGIPVLLKDNIEAKGPVATTAGSLALKDNITGRDAPLVARLRAAGAVILGKTNLSEWANIRSGSSTSGWSAVGDLTKNPHILDRNTCGSSAGSGAAMAAMLATLTVGTETDGSIVCPSGINGVVGFKPTVGLVSRTHIVPISHSQDTAGPMTRSVRDAALMLTAMAGTDAADPATKEADARKTDFAAALSADGLKGKRIGVLRDRLGGRADMIALLDKALAAMVANGATVVDIADSKAGQDGMGEAEFAVLMFELKSDMTAYLAGLPATDAAGRAMPKTLADLIAFNNANASTELRWFDQSLFELAEGKAGLESVEYRDARAKSLRLAGAEGIDRLLAAHKADFLVGITNGPAWVSDLVNGDHYAGPSVSDMPAIAGYPHLTVPMGMVEGLPVGLSIIGAQWDDAAVLNAGHTYEQAAGGAKVPAFLPTLSAD